MSTIEFAEIFKGLREYLKENKEFEVVPERKAEFEKALAAVRELFPSAHIEVRDDPFRMGALIVNIEDYDIEVDGSEGVRIFTRLVEMAGNFEIYPVDADRIGLAIVLQ